MKGFTIFQVLKYGSKTCAWSSEIMVCPQLEYVGPTKAEMLVGPSQYRPHFERQRQADFPRETAKARKEVTDRWQHRLERRLAKQCKPWLKKDDAAVRGFASLGWLDYEPAINQQIKQMAVEDSKFRLADLCQADERYLRIFVEAKLRERCLLRRRVRPEPPAQRSQTALAFLHASSQTLDTSQTLLGDGLGAQLSDGLEADQLGDGLEALSPDAMKRLLEQTSCF